MIKDSVDTSIAAEPARQANVKNDASGSGPAREPERVKDDAYIQGLTDNIKGEVTSYKPFDLNEAIRMAHKLMEQKSQARDVRILEGKK
nr:hypothetical protein [Tanacetum cinerariifolium]